MTKSRGVPPAGKAIAVLERHQHALVHVTCQLGICLILTDRIYNDFLTLRGIPPQVFEYRLGNRSALDWVIDQYQVSTDKRSGITNDPNRADDPHFIIRLIGQVTTVSLETAKLGIALSTFSILPNTD